TKGIRIPRFFRNEETTSWGLKLDLWSDSFSSCAVECKIFLCPSIEISNRSANVSRFTCSAYEKSLNNSPHVSTDNLSVLIANSGKKLHLYCCLNRCRVQDVLLV